MLYDAFHFLYNVTVHQHDGKTPYQKRFGSEFPGPLLPFGSAVSYKPSDDATLATLPKFGERTTPGLFAGYHLHNGCTWSKDLYFYNISKLQNATELHHIHHHRVKEFVIPQRIVYPVADGTISLLSELDRMPRLLHDQPVQPDAIDTGGDSVPDHETDTSNAGGPIEEPKGPSEPDYWRFAGMSLTRVHRQPRCQYYRPDQDPDLPIPLRFLDVKRSITIQTDLQVQHVDDFWNTTSPETCHDESWTGSTRFEILLPHPGEGYKYVQGRRTRIQKSRRPDTICPEDWRALSKKEQELEREKGLAYLEKLHDARRQNSLDDYIKPDDLEEYYAAVDVLRDAHGEPEIEHAMPIVSSALADESHRENHLNDFIPPTFALVARPLQRNEYMRIPAAKAALQKEWDRHHNKGTWDLSSVREYDDVCREAERTQSQCHFGHLIPLCHEKHSELPPDQRVHKGRVVFAGNRVKNESGLQAVFSEQSSSACLVAGIKTLDAIARIPGNAGEDRDAEQAYIQANLGGPPTWVHLPPDQWPDTWKGKYTKPVVRLKLALYGHPLAGLYWEHKAHNAILACGFKKIPNWECLFYHTKLQLMLGIYVDDVKLVGKASNLDAGWKLLESHIEFGPRTPFREFLGCHQQKYTCST